MVTVVVVVVCSKLDTIFLMFGASHRKYLQVYGHFLLPICTNIYIQYNVCVGEREMTLSHSS